MSIGYWSLWGQPRSVTSGHLRWPWNSCDARSRVTASHVLTPITSTVPIQVNRATPSCVYSRFRWNLAEGCSLCDVINSWPDLTWPIFFHQKLRKGRSISYAKFQHDTPNGLACSSEKFMGGSISPPPLARVKISKINIFNAEYQNVFTLPRHPTGASSNCAMKLYVWRSWAASLWNRKITSLSSKTKNLHKKNMNECTPTQYGVKQPSVEAANAHGK